MFYRHQTSNTELASPQPMVASSRRGEPARSAQLVDVAALRSAYAKNGPDASNPEQKVSFGTSGHRGSSLSHSFNEAHVLAISQAVADYRAGHDIAGPLFLGIDTHGLSAPALETTLEVLTANDVTVFVDQDAGYTPTPAVSLAIVTHNSARRGPLADGVVITPSHNPPEDGGFKYNPPHGGPAGTDVTSWIEDRANEILTDDLRGVRRTPSGKAQRDGRVHRYDFLRSYVEQLHSVIDLEAVQMAGVRIGVDPLGGASVAYWPAIAERYGLDLTVVNDTIDPTFRFMTLDRDGLIRMDCSSPYAMARIISSAERFDISFGNDPDADRHGIVIPSVGLLPPNHFLVVATSYLFTHRPGWPVRAGVGKTIVTSAMIDRVADELDRPLVETPVGFKWFVNGFCDGSIAFACEESAGASLLRHNGSPWTTDKDGIALCLLGAEILARTGCGLDARYDELVARFGRPHYRRIDAPATREQKRSLARLEPSDVRAENLAGDEIVERRTTTSNGDAIGGLKIKTNRGWFVARPSGTEDVYKLYAESFAGEDHLQQIVDDAETIIERVLGKGRTVDAEDDGN